MSAIVNGHEITGAISLPNFNKWQWGYSLDNDRKAIFLCPDCAEPITRAKEIGEKRLLEAYATIDLRRKR